MKSFNNNYDVFSGIFYLITDECIYEDLDLLEYFFAVDQISGVFQAFYEDI